MSLEDIGLGSLLSIYHDPLGKPYVLISDNSGQTQLLMVGTTDYRGGINFAQNVPTAIVGQITSGKLQYDSTNYALRFECNFNSAGFVFCAYAGIPLLIINPLGEIVDYNKHVMLSPTTLGTYVVNSSLTSVGTLNNLTVAGDVTVDTSTLKVDSTNHRVGVVNASPAYALDVVGDVNTSTSYKIGGTSVLTSTTLGAGVTSSSLTSVGTLSSLTVVGDLTVDTNTLVVDSVNNRVGVAKTPSFGLDVAGTVNVGNGQTYRVNATTVLSATSIGSTVVSSSLTSVGTLTTLAVSGDVTVNTTNFKVDTAHGRVGIGTATPSYDLDIRGSAPYLVLGGSSVGKELRFTWYEAGNTSYLTIGGDSKLQVRDTSNNVKNTFNVSTGIFDSKVGYSIDGTTVLNSTTLGSAVTTSSLTSVGTLSSLTVTGDVTIDSTTLKVDSTNNRVGIVNASPAYPLDVVGDCNLSTGSKYRINGVDVFANDDLYDSYTRTTTLALALTFTGYLVTFDQVNNATTGLVYSAGRFTNSTGRSRLVMIAARGASTTSSSNHQLTVSFGVNGFENTSKLGTTAANPFTLSSGTNLLLRNNDYFEVKVQSTQVTTTLSTGFEIMITLAG
jgi:hypothetical protein